MGLVLALLASVWGLFDAAGSSRAVSMSPRAAAIFGAVETLVLLYTLGLWLLARRKGTPEAWWLLVPFVCLLLLVPVWAGSPVWADSRGRLWHFTLGAQLVAPVALLLVLPSPAS
jgi:hypothetical protein